MFRTLGILLSILALSLPALAETFSPCGHYAGGKAPAPVSGRELVIKNYVYAALAFPQTLTGIFLNLHALLLSGKVDLQDYPSHISQAEFTKIFRAMEASNRAHGIREVEESELKDILRTLKSFAYHFKTILIHLVLPLKFGDDLTIEDVPTAEIVARFRTDPEFQEVSANYQKYAETVLEALRSREAIDLSLRYRAGLSPNLRVETSRIFDSSLIDERLKDLVVSHLETRHPELQEQIATPYGPETRARAFVIAIN